MAAPQKNIFFGTLTFAHANMHSDLKCIVFDLHKRTFSRLNCGATSSIESPQEQLDTKSPREFYFDLYKPLEEKENQMQCLHWKYILTMRAWCHISNSHSCKKHWSYSKGRVTLLLTYSNSYLFLLNFSLAISKTGTLIKKRGIWLTSAQIGVFFFYDWGEQ